MLFLVADAFLERRKSKFRLHLMPIAVGAYLPFGIAPPILIGGLIAWFAARHTKTEEAREKRLQRGVLFSSGIIAGEALMGVLVALLTVKGISGKLGVGEGLQNLLTGIAAFAVLALFVWASREWRPSRRENS